MANFRIGVEVTFNPSIWLFRSLPFHTEHPICLLLGVSSNIWGKSSRTAAFSFLNTWRNFLALGLVHPACDSILWTFHFNIFFKIFEIPFIGFSVKDLNDIRKISFRGNYLFDMSYLLIIITNAFVDLTNLFIENNVLGSNLFYLFSNL